MNKTLLFFGVCALIVLFFSVGSEPKACPAKLTDNGRTYGYLDNYYEYGFDVGTYDCFAGEPLESDAYFLAPEPGERPPSQAEANQFSAGRVDGCKAILEEMQSHP